MLHAALTIYLSRRVMDRHHLAAEILDELATYSPTKAMRLMRHWPGGRLSLVHLNVLFILETDGPLPMRGLAEAMDVSQASATGIVDRMEQRGLVERQRDEADRRIIRVAVTDEGHRLVEGMAAQRRDHLARMLDEMTDEELAAYLVGVRAMRRIREQLHDELHAGGDPAPETARDAARDPDHTTAPAAAGRHAPTPSPDPQETPR
jgi:DNA-binding MarR family transcriptional regulator